jgi:hypothetical protein
MKEKSDQLADQLVAIATDSGTFISKESALQLIIKLASSKFDQ